ncbi:aldo/keto reductase [Oscillibacter sp. MSJ-2]|uniref:Aldo/keto reductase n=1 Tax=Dysosmobacter acutus TaxID=2841504 RepID=A0ABS6F756_9FIRM|nr:aldo/keto reductase [Dysosmobacter acutus]MBU5626119.1 aldo/keto reductase [Dysosmobacter acutus]
MDYRKLPHGGEQISILGLGTSSIGMAGEKDIRATVEMALENGVNFFDMASADAAPFPVYGEAMKGCRDKAYFQIHFGADYHTGQYGWTTKLDTIKKSIDWQLSALKTDYIDFGFLHCIDEEADLDRVLDSGVLDYIQKLQAEGTVRYIGLSSHTPRLAHRVLDLGAIDLLMFSINPGYDYRHGEYAIGQPDERMALYRRCEAEGVGISVMKAFSGGQLLDAKTSPFGKALTEYQCIQYALDKPGVLTVLPGVRDRADLQRILGFLNASSEKRDYAVLGSFTPTDTVGTCVYCNHCQPCPAGLDIGLINKYYDLARAGDALAAGHYGKLEKTAGDCISCSHCDRRCPFQVKQVQLMQEIQAYFGK